MWEGGQRIDQIAKGDRRNPRTITAHIERARQERAFEVAQQQQLQEALGAHQRDMLTLIERVHDAVFVPELKLDSDTLSFSSEAIIGLPDLMQERIVGVGPQMDDAILRQLGNEAKSQAVSVTTDESGQPESVRFSEEYSTLWGALRQHLGNKDSLWRDLSVWRRDLLIELQSWAVLNRYVRGKAEEVFGLPVLLKSSPNQARLTHPLVPFVRIEAIRRASGMPATNVTEHIRQTGGRLEYPESSVTLAEGLEDAEKGLEYLVDLVDGIANSTKTVQVGFIHLALKQTASKVRQTLSEYLLLHHIRGTCNLCKKLGGQ